MQLGTTGAVRMALADALRSDNRNNCPRVHRCLLTALTGGTPLSAAAQAARLSLVIQYPPPGLNGGVLDEAAGKLAFADRVTAASFQVRLTVALALIRRGTWDLIGRSVGEWIGGAEADVAGVGNIAHPLGLTLWFCPHLASADPSGDGDALCGRFARRGPILNGGCGDGERAACAH